MFYCHRELNDDGRLQLDQPSSFGLGRLSLVNMTGAKHQVDAYIKFIHDSVKMLSNQSTFSKTVINDQIDELVAFEMEIAKVGDLPFLLIKLIFCRLNAHFSSSGCHSR